MKMFPVLDHQSLSMYGCPAQIPFVLIKQHESQTLRNHGGQSLELIAQRGGLGARELVAVLQNKRWQDTSHLSNSEVVRLLGYILQRRLPFGT